MKSMKVKCKRSEMHLVAGWIVLWTFIWRLLDREILVCVYKLPEGTVSWNDLCSLYKADIKKCMWLLLQPVVTVLSCFWIRPQSH